MWDKLEYPPQPFGQCSICSRHDCGEVVEDGVKKQKWLHVPLELFAGGDLHIGYQCVRGMSEDLGVAVRVVEKEIRVEPSDKQMIRIMRDAFDVWQQINDAEDEFERGETVEWNPDAPDNGGLGAPVMSLTPPNKPKTRQRRASK